MKKRFLCFALSVLSVFAFCTVGVSAAADSNSDLAYESYSYNSDDEPVAVPAPFAVQRIITGTALGVSEFSDIGDIFYDGNGNIFICDIGNNRVIVTDTDFNVKNVLSGFVNTGNEESFNSPSGVFANDEAIYISDTKNARIVVLNKADYSLLRILDKPEITILGEDYKYAPTAVTVDNAGRIYVIGESVNQGLICLDENGEFSTFLGAPSVVPNLAETLWRRFATKEQLEQMQQYVPTEYNAMLIDENGFIYAVSQSSTARPVVKLNSDGDNVLPTVDDDENVADMAYTAEMGAEQTPYFTDIALDKNGTYYILDSKQSKIYVYSKDGYMLYAFSASGSQKGSFSSAAAIEVIDDKILVTDRLKGSITVFDITEFGQCVNIALEFYEAGDYEQAAKAWQEVYNRASGYTLAVVGLAKIDIQNGDYSAAMEKLKPIHEHSLYSKAFEKQRDNFIRDSFYWLLAVVAVLVVGFVFIRKLYKKSRLYGAISTSEILSEIKYANYVMFHPFDGFWDIKREKRGSARSATVILAAFILLYAVRAQFSGYIVTETVSSEVNALYKSALILLPIIFWIIANWCFTALMDGEGTMKDIYTATCFALKPYVLFSIPMFILSHILTDSEAVFYTVLDTVCIVWVIALIFFGMMTTHNYSLSKSLLTAVLTLVGICLIIFILLLFVNVIQEVFTFGYNIYKELLLRSY